MAIIFIFNEILFAWNNEDFHIYSDPNGAYNPCVWGFTYAGYSDYFIWGYSDRHPQESHELLSGEFAAALAWSQGNSNQIYWLTDAFECPRSVSGNP